MKVLEVLYTPADFNALPARNLGGTWCVVFDVFRATSSIATALANGAAAVVPVGEISEALAIRSKDPGVLLAGERDGLRIGAALAGGTEFDFGNSPREFVSERVAGRTLVTTTTNGTRALRACLHADRVLIGSFLNLGATAAFIRKSRPDRVLVVCSGTFEQAAYEDVLGAGALCDLLLDGADTSLAADSAMMARRLFQVAHADLLAAAGSSRNGRRLQSIPELREDVPFCLQVDCFNLVVALDKDGAARAVES